MTDEVPAIRDARDADNTAISLACAVLGVCIVFIVVLNWRFPYIHQLPIFDLDYITTVMMMFARNWWIEGPWHMLFSMPYAPLSVETPTPDLRFGMYQSWPPGAVLPIYLIALLTNTEPNITMVNWLNVCCHGLIALFLSLSAYFAVHMLRRPQIEGVALAIMTGCIVLFPRGPVFFLFANLCVRYLHCRLLCAAHFCRYARISRVGPAFRAALLLSSDRDFGLRSFCRLVILFCVRGLVGAASRRRAHGIWPCGRIEGSLHARDIAVCGFFSFFGLAFPDAGVDSCQTGRAGIGPGTAVEIDFQDGE